MEEEKAINNESSDDIEMTNVLNIQDESKLTKKLFLSHEINKSNNSNNICNNYTCAFFILLIESIISLSKYYIFYKFEFTKIPNIFFGILAIIIIASSLSIFLLVNSKFYAKRKTAGNFIFFILMSIYKFLFGFFILSGIVFYSDKILGYSELEARIYWKITMCCFYIILLIYYYFKGKENSDNLQMYIISTSICLLMITFLTAFTQKSIDDWERIALHITLVYLEIMILVFGIYTGILLRAKNYIIENNELPEIDWKINEIDYLRYCIIIINFLYFSMKFDYKNCKRKCRYCRIIINNYY